MHYTLPEFTNYGINTKGEVINLTTRKTLKQYENNNGYIKVTLFHKGKKKNFFIHRLLCEMFIPNPDNKAEVNHKNGMKDDNRLENLEWVTHKENSIHAYNVLKVKPSMLGRFGKRHGASKPVAQYTLHGVLMKIWDSGADAEISGYSKVCISYCCSGKIKTHSRYVWRRAIRI